VLIGSVVGYVIFQSTANFQYRPSRAVGTQIEMLSSRLMSTVTHLIQAIWNVFVGAYANAGAKIVFDADSSSTLVAATMGVVTAVLMLQLLKTNREEISNHKRETFAMILAVVAGLLPVIIANQSPAGGDSYETRFFIPVLPFATIVTARTIFCFTKQISRPIIAALLTFIAITTVFNAAFAARREQKSMEIFGKLLRPIVERNSAMTIVVVPSYEKLDGSDITPKVVLNWPPELIQKVWIITEPEMIALNGHRLYCKSMDFNLAPAFLSSGRKGAISNLFFVPEFWNSKKGFSKDSFEPYCIHEF
jgi:hypothetical protein